MAILCCSGSVRADSSNLKLLQTIASSFDTYHFDYFDLSRLPLFLPALDHSPWPAEVLAWREAVAEASAVLITTPAYLQNLPALVKNALEWLVTSGELRGKAVLPVTFCPHPPRGAEAMQAMIWSLQALDARIVGQLPLYQNEMQATAEGYELDEELHLLLAAALEELVS